MRAENEFDEATAADENNPFAPPERVDETADGWAFADAPSERVVESDPFAPPSFRGAFWYCLRHMFDFKSRANRTEYFGWLAGASVVFLALGFVAGLGTLASAGATKEISFRFSSALGLAASVPDFAVWIRRLRDQNVGLGWKTGVVILASAGYVAFGIKLLDYDMALSGIWEALWCAAIPLAGMSAGMLTFLWGPGIWEFGYDAARLVTTPEQAAAKIVEGVLMAALWIWLRAICLGFRAGTPGPNRFGAERITPKEAARREREKNEEEV